MQEKENIHPGSTNRKAHKKACYVVHLWKKCSVLNGKKQMIVKFPCTHLDFIILRITGIILICKDPYIYLMKLNEA